MCFGYLTRMTPPPPTPKTLDVSLPETLSCHCLFFSYQCAYLMSAQRIPCFMKLWLRMCIEYKGG